MPSSPKSRFYVNGVAQDPRDPKKGVLVLLAVPNCKDEKEAREVAERAVRNYKIENVTLHHP